MLRERITGFLLDCADIAFPRHCVVCGKRLRQNERICCTACYFAFPRVDSLIEQQIVERIFWGKIDIRKAVAHLRFEPENTTRQLVHALKYHNRPDIGRVFGYRLALERAREDFFNGIDAIVPVPLTKARLRKRGYNQSEELARGITRATGLPVWNDIVARRREKDKSQTLVLKFERQKNVEEAFRLAKPEKIAGKHLLLVDDVMTTGSTLLSCARTLDTAGQVSFSIFTLALAGYHPRPLYTEKDDEDRRFGDLPFETWI